MIFENVRMQHYSELPSRLDCIFGCPSLDSMKEFVRFTGRGLDLIYEAEPVNSKAIQFETDWSLVKPLQNMSLGQAEGLAHEYWKGKSVREINPLNLEILISSDIRIINRVDLSASEYPS
jgi:hypothetical protein